MAVVRERWDRGADIGKILEDLTSGYEWIAKALQSSGYVADFSPDSLREIERFFEEQTLNGAARPGGLLSESLGARLFALGGYVGEVIRRERGGHGLAMMTIRRLRSILRRSSLTAA